MLVKNIKGWKITGVIFLSLIIAISIAVYFVFSRLENIVKAELENQCSSASDGFYKLKIGDVKISLWDGYLTLENISLKPDSQLLFSKKTTDPETFRYYNFNLKKIEFTGVNFRKKFSNRQLHFSQILLRKPEVLVFEQKGVDNVVENDTTTKISKNPYEYITPLLKSLIVEEIKIEDGNAVYRIINPSDTIDYTLRDIQLKVENLLLDSMSVKQDKIFFSDNIFLNVGNLHFSLPNKDYDIDANNINISLNDSLFSTEEMALIPRYAKFDFAYKIKDHPDWSNVKVGSLRCKGMDFKTLIKGRIILADSALVKDVLFENFKNQKIIKQHHLMPMVYEIGQQLPLKYDVKSVQARNFNVVYEELPKDGAKPGMIRFNDINGDFTDFTNIVKSHKQVVKLKANGKLMNQGVINAYFEFPVDPAYDLVKIKGTMTGMKMTALNPIIEPMMPARIESGHIQSLDFHIVGGKYNANIDMLLLYNDLKIDVLKTESDKTRSSQDVYSFLANAFIKHDNPDKDKEPRRIYTIWKRDPYHSSFNYLWKIFYAGIVETVGYTKDKQKKVNSIQKVFNDVKDWYKKE